MKPSHDSAPKTPDSGDPSTLIRDEDEADRWLEQEAEPVLMAMERMESRIACPDKNHTSMYFALSAVAYLRAHFEAKRQHLLPRTDDEVAGDIQYTLKDCRHALDDFRRAGILPAAEIPELRTSDEFFDFYQRLWPTARGTDEEILAACHAWIQVALRFSEQRWVE